MTPFALPISATASLRVGVVREVNLTRDGVLLFDDRENEPGIPVDPPYADAWLRLFGLTPPSPAAPSVASPHSDDGNSVGGPDV